MLLTDYIYLFILFVAAFFGILHFKKCSLTFRLLTFFLLLTFCKETPDTLMVYAGKDNSFLQNVYTPLHVAFFVTIYYVILFNTSVRNIVLYFGCIVFITVLTGVITSEMNQLPWIFISVDAVMLVTFSILYFYNLMRYPVEQNIIASGDVWLSTSVLIYFTASFIFWISYPYISKQGEANREVLFYILDQLGSVHYFLLFIALYLHVRQQRKNVSTAS